MCHPLIGEPITPSHGTGYPPTTTLSSLVADVYCVLWPLALDVLHFPSFYPETTGKVLRIFIGGLNWPFSVHSVRLEHVCEVDI